MPKKPSAKTPENSCRALLVINDKKLRAAAFRKAKGSLRSLERLEQTAKDFDGRDQELFNAWRDEALADVNREAEKLRAEVKKRQERHFRTRELSHCENIKMGVAFERIVEEEAAYELGNLDRKRELEAAWTEREKIFKVYLDEEERKEREEAERWRKRMEEEARRKREEQSRKEAPPEEDEVYDQDDEEDPWDRADQWRHVGEDCWQRFPENTAPTPEEEEELKLRYRQLVKHLHPDKKGPDSTGKLEPWQQRLWEDAKHAVEIGDLPRMKYLYAMAMLRLGRLETLTVDEILGCARWFDAEKSNLKFDNMDRRKSPVWNFSRRKNLLSLYWKLRRKVDKETEQLRLMELSLEWREANWKKYEMDDSQPL